MVRLNATSAANDALPAARVEIGYARASNSAPASAIAEDCSGGLFVGGGAPRF
jgi:hypothetical protein